MASWRAKQSAGLAVVVVLAACASPPVFVESPPQHAPRRDDSLMSMLEFAASVRELPLADQRALIDAHTSRSEEEVSTEDTMRLALLYLSAWTRASELDRAEALLEDIVVRDGETELAVLATLLIDALHSLPAASPAAPLPNATGQDDRDNEIAALRAALEAEHGRRMRLEAQLEALLELELELGDAAETQAETIDEQTPR